jgi:glycosyltransferase involved in cell wall biosynthesis
MTQKKEKKVNSTMKKKKINTIFIQIASYRDPQLLPTLEDMISKAKYPDNLRIGICWQHSTDDSWDSLDKYKNDSRFKIIDVDHKESKGVCWARNAVQQLYDKETYTLQLDSHHRFVKDWDEILIDMVKGLQSKGHKKPLLTAYIPSFDPDNDPSGRVLEPWKMNFDRFIPEGAVFFLPASFDTWDDKSSPLPARFYSAHFAFSLGSFAKEVQHDPDYYFHGEEISIAVRAYTHGYDLFHPNKVVCWHEYTRKGRTKQWDDDKDWGQKNTRSHLKNRKLFEMDGEKRDVDFGIYGFGNERTLRDYEKYSGLCFGKRAITEQVNKHLAPPDSLQNASDEEFDKALMSIFKHCIDIGFTQVPENDYDFWAVAFKDESGNDVYRKDADKDEILRMKSDPDGYCKVWREFQIPKKPHSWLVWPHSISKGWADPITGVLP